MLDVCHRWNRLIASCTLNISSLFTFFAIAFKNGGIEKKALLFKKDGNYDRET